MADSKFRRTVLFQIMVVMRFLLSLTASECEKRIARTKTPNKVLLYSFTLSLEDAAWAQQKDKDAYNLTDLAFQPHPQYRTFSKAVRAVLDRDEAWVRWKENGCPSFEEPNWIEKEFDVVEKNLRQIIAPLQPYRFPLGNQALSDLWKGADNLTQESLKGRVELPSPEDFLTEEIEKASLEELTPSEEIEKIDERASREWRGLRLAMKYDMAKVTEHKGSLTKYVESKLGVKRDNKDVEMPDAPVGESLKMEDVRTETPNGK
jgi:THO complex subunit 1